MKTNETVPLLTTLAPALAVAQPLLFGGAIVLGLIGLVSANNETAATPPEQPKPSKAGPAMPVSA